MKMSVAVRMYKNKRQIYDGTQCIEADSQSEVQAWFSDLCDETLGDDVDDVVRVRHSDVITVDFDQDQDGFDMELAEVFTLENGVKYVMLAYAKFYDVDEEL